MIHFAPDMTAMALAGLITGGLAIHLWRYRSQPSILPMACGMAFACLWALDVVAEFHLDDLDWKYFLVMAKPFATLGLVSSMAVLAVVHTGSLSFLRRRHLALLFVIPLVTLIFTATAGQHELYRFNFRLRPHGALQALTWDGGPWQALTHLYSDALALFAFTLFWKSAWNAQRRYRRGMLFTAVSWLVPFAADFPSKLGLLGQEVNLSAYGLCFAAAVSCWTLTMYRLLSAGPIARDLVVERMDDLLFVIDSQGELVDCNQSAAAALGVQHRDWTSTQPAALGAPWNEIMTVSSQARCQVQIRSGDRPRTYERLEMPLHDRRERYLGQAILLHDITHLEEMRALVDGKNAELAAVNDALRREMEQRKRTEAQLQEAGRLETVGRLAGGVAHDFNNLLTVINGHSEMMLNELAPGSSFRLHAEQIAKAGDRAAEMTQQLLAFSRKQLSRPRPLDLNQVVLDEEKLFSQLIGTDIDLVLKLHGCPGHVIADPGQMHQVLMNLVVNARDAMPNGGTLTIETSDADSGVQAPAGSDGVPPGACVRLAVSDTGIGMSQEVRQHIFEPFFTTKELGRGTGLGLATVYGIVRQCGGWIGVRSQPGQGSTFDVYLPRGNAAPAEAGSSPARAIASRGRETVLVVEDHAEVRELAIGSLTRFGYQVLAASCGPEALDLVRAHSEPVHLLLTDVVMPGMNGRQLADLLTGIRPEIRVLFISGYAAEVIARNGVLPQDVSYLAKPFSPAGLAVKVREVLDAPGQARAGAAPAAPPGLLPA
jgi:signal transduction histidine kinase/CheY-like chemotaxis protein